MGTVENYVLDLAQKLEEMADFGDCSEETQFSLLEIAYEIRLKYGNDVGALMAYWDDPRFADRMEKDYRVAETD